MAVDVARFGQFVAPVEGGYVYGMHTVPIEAETEESTARIMQLANGIYDLRYRAGLRTYGPPAYIGAITSGQDGDYVAIGEAPVPDPAPLYAYATRERIGDDTIGVPEALMHPWLVREPELYRAVGEALFLTLFSELSPDLRVVVASRHPSSIGRNIVTSFGLQHGLIFGQRRYGYGFHGTVANVMEHLDR